MRPLVHTTVQRFPPPAADLCGEVWRPAGSPVGAVILIAGFGGVVDEPLRRVAARFTEAGLVAIVPDRPGFGGSDGEPRLDLDVDRDLDAFERVLTATRGDLPCAAWGTSFGCLEAALLAQRFPLVRAVVVQAPPRAVAVDPAVRPDVLRALERDALAHAGGAPLRRIPVVARGGAPCAIAGDDAYAWFARQAPPQWENAVTLRSAWRCGQMDCAAALEASTVPVLAVGVTEDPRALDLSTLRVAERFSLPGTHFELYDRLLVAAADRAARFLVARVAS